MMRCCPIPPRGGFLPRIVVACSLACQSPPPAAPAPVRPEVDSLLRNALQPLSGQSIAVTVDSAPIQFPATTFYRATRIPPFSQGLEDARPATAAVVERANSIVCVTRMHDIPAVWLLAKPGTIHDTAGALLSISQLLMLTGTVNSEQVLHSPAEAKEAASASTVDNLQALDSVGPPMVRHQAERLELQLYVDRPSGIWEYSFWFTDQQNMELQLHERRLSRRWLGP